MQTYVDKYVHISIELPALTCLVRMVISLTFYTFVKMFIQLTNSTLVQVFLVQDICMCVYVRINPVILHVAELAVAIQILYCFIYVLVRLNVLSPVIMHSLSECYCVFGYTSF